TTDVSESDRFAWSHINAPEVDLPLLLHNVFHQIKVTNGDATAGENKIIGEGLGELFTQTFGSIASDAEAMWLCTCLAYCCFKQITVAVANLAGAQRLIYLNDLVACTQNGYSW